MDQAADGDAGGAGGAAAGTGTQGDGGTGAESNVLDGGAGAAAGAGAGAGGDAGGGADGGKGTKAKPAGKGGKAAGTAAGADAGSGGDAAAGKDQQFWPATWREKWAGDDAKKLARLQRYASPEAAFDAGIAAQDRIRSGEFKTQRPANAKPEELVQWRKDNGLPESPDKYDLTFKDGLVIGEEDKPVIDAFLKRAHDKDYSNEQVREAVSWYYAEQERQSQVRAQRDNVDRTKCLDVLNQEWGAEFRPHVNAIENLLSKFPPDVAKLLRAGRLADGTGIFNHPAVLRGFAALALDANPAALRVPGGGGDPAKSMLDRYNEIGKMRSTDRPAYDKDAKLQEEERSLITGLQKMGVMDEQGNIVKKAA